MLKFSDTPDILQYNTVNVLAMNQEVARIGSFLCKNGFSENKSLFDLDRSSSTTKTYKNQEGKYIFVNSFKNGGEYKPSIAISGNALTPELRQDLINVASMTLDENDLQANQTKKMGL